VQDVHLRSGLVKRPDRLRGDQPLALEELRALAAEQLRRDDALEILVELLEEAEPAPVGLEPKPVELLPQSGKPLRKATLDLGFQESEFLFAFDGRHSHGLYLNCWSGDRYTGSR